MSDRLNGLLADLISLYGAAKTAHWNVRGSGFAALHAFFEETATLLSAEVDKVAERAVQLQIPAIGDPAAVAGLRTLRAFPAGFVRGTQALPELAALIKQAEQHALRLIDVYADDAVTADLLTQTAATLANRHWQTLAHDDQAL